MFRSPALHCRRLSCRHIQVHHQRSVRFCVLAMSANTAVGLSAVLARSPICQRLCKRAILLVREEKLTG